jgi:hypothetical protein
MNNLFRFQQKSQNKALSIFVYHIFPTELGKSLFILHGNKFNTLHLKLLFCNLLIPAKILQFLQFLLIQLHYHQFYNRDMLQFYAQFFNDCLCLLL